MGRYDVVQQKYTLATCSSSLPRFVYVLYIGNGCGLRDYVYRLRIPTTYTDYVYRIRIPEAIEVTQPWQSALGPLLVFDVPHR